MLSKIIYFLIFTISFAGCTNFLTDPQEIIDSSIEAAGGERYLNSIIEFDFHDQHYVVKRKGDTFSYEGMFKDSLGAIRDIVTNKGHVRELNGMMEVLPDSVSVKFKTSIYSVIYFALLPFGLNDSSVQKKYLGDTMIENKLFYKIKIERGQDVADNEFQSTFQYWINREDFTIGYIAYSLNEKDRVGLRFCKAIQPRKVDGIQFYNYIHHKPKSDSVKMEELELLFTKGELEELNTAELMNIAVNYNPL